MKKYKIWEFNFYLGCANNFGNDEMTYFNFVVKKEHMFLRISKILKIITSQLKMLSNFLYFGMDFILEIVIFNT